MKWFASFRHECIYCKILAGITCIVLLGVIVYFGHDGWHIEEPKNLIYHYQTLVTGAIALIVGIYTVISIRGQINQQENLNTDQRISVEIAFLNALKSYIDDIHKKRHKFNTYKPGAENQVYAYINNNDESVLNAEIPAIVLDWHVLAQIRPYRLNLFMEYRKEAEIIKKSIEILNIKSDAKVVIGTMSDTFTKVNDIQKQISDTLSEYKTS